MRKKRHYLPAEERRKQILETTRPIFARAGLKGARTRELTQAAGINQATLFEHFKSKEELFTAAVVQPLVATIEGARERASAYASAAPDDQLALLHSNMEQELQRMIDIYPLLLQALASSEELGQHLYREQIVPLLNARADIMGAYVSDALDPRLIQLASFGMFFALAMDHTLSGQRRDLADSARQLTELITNGCAPTTRRVGQTDPTKPASPAKKALPAKKMPAAKKTPADGRASSAQKTSSARNTSSAKKASAAAENPARKAVPVKNTQAAPKAGAAKRTTTSGRQPAPRAKPTAPKTSAGSRTRNK